MSCPTAPGKEAAVIEAVRAWAAGKGGVSFRCDKAGNGVLHYRRGRPRRQWVLAAHMDHPGFVVTESSSRRRVAAEFRGGVAKGYFLGRRVRLFTPDGEVVGTVAAIRRRNERRRRPCRIALDSAADVSAGTVGMWDLPAYRVRAGRVRARACDDLAGVAAALCALAEVRTRKLSADVTVLLTRAEEAGLLGALAACKAGTLPPGALVVGLETSEAQAAAPLGGGVVVRAGDRLSVFDAELTDHISAVAAALAKRSKTFHYERRVMPGGVCESSVFLAMGWQAAALALPLGNYHNMGDDGEIRPERIDLGDFASCVKLLVALVAERTGPADTAANRRRTRRKRLAAGRDILR